MKFPRNARVFRGQLEVAPFATVFFLLAMFMMLGSLIYTPGVELKLPEATDLPGMDKQPAVTIDKNGRLYFENQLIQENDLKVRLRTAVANSAEPLTLIVQADEAVSYKMLIRMTLLAREVGFSNAWLATVPSLFSTPNPYSFQ